MTVEIGSSLPRRMRIRTLQLGQSQGPTKKAQLDSKPHSAKQIVGQFSL
jgi:hypothetical protein